MFYLISLNEFFFLLYLSKIDKQQQINQMTAKTKFMDSNRHSHKGLKQPSIENIPKLCKIIFSLDQTDFQIEIFPSSNIKQLAKQLAEYLGLQCNQIFEEQIYCKMQQLYNTTQQDDDWRFDMRLVMQTAKIQKKYKAIKSKDLNQNSTRQIQLEDNDWKTAIDSVNGMFTQKRFYFQTNRLYQNNYGIESSFRQVIQSEQDQDLQTLQELSLYEKAIYNRKAKQNQIVRIKMEKQKQQMKQCTFHPRINMRKKSKTPERKQNIFRKLYQNAIDLKRKRQERFNTVQSEKQEEISVIPFAPQLNQCSREIIRRRNQSVQSVRSVNRHCQSHQILSKKDLNSRSFYEQSHREIQKYDQTFTFHPQLSKNTKQLTKGLPNIEQRLRRYQQNDKKKRFSTNIAFISNKKSDSNPSFERMNIKKPNKIFFGSKQQSKNKKIDGDTVKKTFRKKKIQQNKKYFDTSTSKKNINTKSQIIKPRKQLYEIEDTPIFTNQSQFEEMLVIAQGKPEQVFHDITNTMNQHVTKDKTTPKETRSQYLYNNRKNAIFQRIFLYLIEESNITISQFAKNQKKSRKNENNSQVTFQKILNNPYLPSVVKNMLFPVTSQMSQLNISLNHQQFIWALQKIYESLTVGDKGVLLGWGVKLLPQNSSFF